MTKQRYGKQKIGVKHFSPPCYQRAVSVSAYENRGFCKVGQSAFGIIHTCKGNLALQLFTRLESDMYQHTDGGAEAAGRKGGSDCGIRAVAVACEKPYRDVEKLLREFAKRGKAGNGQISRGIYKEDMEAALKSIGWRWVSAPKFEGRKARYSDLPKGRHIARMARHYAAVIDGVLMDSWNSSEKMVYGYWTEVGE